MHIYTWIRYKTTVFYQECCSAVLFKVAISVLLRL